MKHYNVAANIIVSILLLTTHTTICAQQKISINMRNFTCYDESLKQQYKAESVKAFAVASDLFSSQEFQDSLQKLSFPVKTLCKSCGPGRKSFQRGISGEQVLSILFNKKSDFLDLDMQKKSGALGATVPCQSLTTAYYQNIYNDMCHLPADIRLAVNLCHEYMHHIGFCHEQNPKDTTLRLMVKKDNCRIEYYDPISYKNDVAYRVGWIAYDILNRKYGNKSK